MPAHSLKQTLDALTEECQLAERIRRDPVQFPRRYDSPADGEVVAFIASALAYGKVDLFMAVTSKILAGLGKRPAEFIGNFDPKRDKKRFSGIYYRLSTEADIVCLLYLLGEVLKRHGSLKKTFSEGWAPEEDTIGQAVSRFTHTALAIDTTPVYGRNTRPQGITHLFPSPDQGSPCKRLCMFLRWMVRPDDGVDLGLWPEIPPSKLVIPLDTHIARISRMIGLTRLKNPSWRMAVDITNHLRQFDPNDPVKYDFALAHLGISGDCPTRRDAVKCAPCNLAPFCITVER
ncbi:MAG: TIGR02757 family protein [Nitrospirota bacterium]|nr:TIGR02757 family protein [Nitrospirota bacterium]